MKRLTVIFGLFVALIFAPSVRSSAQVCGSEAWLNQLVPNNVTIELLNTSGVPVSSVSPGTNYTLRVRATAWTCLVSGSGCATGAAPTAFLVVFATGCTIQGLTVPPPVGMDVGSGTNYTANFNLTTLPSGSFGGQVFLLVRARGSEVNVCDFRESSNVASFEISQ